MTRIDPNLRYSRAATARRIGAIPSHNDVARAKLNVSTRTMADRIVAMIGQATPEQWADGVNWYHNARNLAATLTTIGEGMTLDRAAAVISALSPRCRWELNARQAIAVVNGTAVPRPILPANLARARRVMTCASPSDAFDPFDAPKIYRFARNIAGDDSAVTVDIWAARVALGMGKGESPDSLLSRVGAYAAIEHAYRVAARRLGLTPSAAQAVAWVVITGR